MTGGSALSDRARRTLGGYFATVAGLVGVGVFRGLPVRDAWVDTVAAALCLGLVVAALGLFGRAPWRERLARAVAWSLLVVGLVTVAAITLTASHIAGLYGPVGSGGALIFGLVAALLVPYLIVAPAMAVHWLSRRRPR